MGLGTDHDCDAQLLRDIAKRGGGDCYFSNDPDEIPRIFAQDTFTLARSTFIDQPTPFAVTAGYSLLGAQPNTAPPQLGGYNLCYIRPQANLAAITSDEYKAPVVASWNAGNGRVICYLGEADGKYSGDFAHWKETGDFYSTLARWVAGKHQTLPDEMLLTQEIRDGVCFVQLHLDPARKSELFSALPQVRVLHGVPGAPPTRQTIPLEWKSADLLEAAIPVIGRETVLNTVEIAGQQPVILPAVCLPYSPEFAPDEPGRGAASLAQISATTGGRELVEIPKIWSALPIKSRYVEMAPWLLVVAAILFLSEIFERRTGWLGRALHLTPVAAPRRNAAKNPQEEKEAPATPRVVTQSGIRNTQPTIQPSATPIIPATPAPAAKSAPAKPAAEVSAIDALRKARERAKNRTEK